MTAMLRVSVGTLDLDDCLARFSKHTVDRVWRAGDRGFNNRVSPTSGFSILLSDSEDGTVVVQEAAAMLSRLANIVAELVQSGATAEIDFAVFVRPTTPLSIAFDAATLRSIEQIGLRMVVSSYPATDEDDSGESGE